jgi:hypothetical protein
METYIDIKKEFGLDANQISKNSFLHKSTLVNRVQPNEIGQTTSNEGITDTHPTFDLRHLEKPIYSGNITDGPRDESPITTAQCIIQNSSPSLDE